MVERPEITRDAVLDALSKVADPGSGQDIVSSGMVAGTTINDRHVFVTLEVDPAQGPALEGVRQQAETALAAIPGVLSATAVLTAERPARTPETGAARRKGGSPARRLEVNGVDAIIAVASGKGGVGKSTTAVNLALALAAEGQRVGLMDADIYGPSLPRMLGIADKPDAPDGRKLKPLLRHGVKAMSIGFMIGEETAMVWRGPMVQSAILQMLRDVDWAGPDGRLDILVVDMPPGTGDAQLTLAQQAPLAGAVIVSTPQDIALVDARRGINMFRKVEVPVLGIVENMSYFTCPHCGERSDIFGHGGARQEAERLEVPFLGAIPLHVAIRETSDTGEPIVASQPDGPHALAYRDVARQVIASLGGGQRRAQPRIVTT